jgi:glucokinase
MTDLIADIGATNARFALVGDGLRDAGPEAIRVLSVQAYDGLADAMAAYLDATGTSADGIERAAICIAGPVTGDLVTMTNHPWSFRQSDLISEFGLTALHVMNDFTAMALALPRLKRADRHQVGGGEPVHGTAMAVLGPGTGLGVSGLIPLDSSTRGEVSWQPLSGEGGHVTLAAETEREAAILATQRALTGHVSAEDFICGRGLVALYEAICRTDGKPLPSRLTPADVTNRALESTDTVAVETVNCFCGWLGNVAGNLALTIGANGGVHIAGGIVPRLGRHFDASPFRARFEQKGRFQPYLAAIPTYVVIHEFPAFLGLISRLHAR